MSGALPAVVYRYGNGEMTEAAWFSMTLDARALWVRKARGRMWRRAAAREKREAAYEIYAQSIVCLIEALIELRPYLPEADA